MTLQDFFENCRLQNTKIALAFSGGVDSSYLLYEGIKSGAQITAFYVKSEFQPQFEFDDAMRLAGSLNADLQIIRLSVLENSVVCSNPGNRCYYCKRAIFGKILEAAEAAGCSIVLDGTNASDDISDRPGFAALQEMKVASPLRDAGLTKEEIRALSKEAGLFTWNKPAYACLATRIKTGDLITKENLEATEKAEGILFDEGFTDFRIRNEKGTGKIQLKKDQVPVFLKRENELIEKLKPYYNEIFLDREVTR